MLHRQQSCQDLGVFVFLESNRCDKIIDFSYHAAHSFPFLLEDRPSLNSAHKNKQEMLHTLPST